MPQPVTVTITSPADVLDVVPTLLGFYPTESLCAVVLGDTAKGRRVVVTMRVDMPTTTSDAVHTAAVLQQCVTAHGRSAIVVAYTADQASARSVLAEVIGAVEPGRLESVVLAVPEGWAVVDLARPTYVTWVNPYRSGISVAAAQVAAAGLYAYGTRDDITDSISAPDPASVTAFEAAWSALPASDRTTEVSTARKVDDVTAYLTEYLAAPFTITTEDAAWLVALVQDVAVRDAALLLITRATAAAHVEVWRQVAALTPNISEALPALTILGMAAWISGQGALTNVAASRGDALPGAGDYSLLRLLHHTQDQALPPTLWDQLRGDRECGPHRRQGSG